MGRRGTKPKPTTLKILHGERPQRINPDEPKALPPGSLEQGEVVASGEGEQDLDARVQQRSRRERSPLVHGAGV